MDQVHRACGAELAQAIFEPVQVRSHERLYVGVGAHGVETLELAHLGRHFAANRHGDIRCRFEEELAEPTFVLTVAIAVDEPDGHGLVTTVDYLPHHLAGGGLVELEEHLTVGIETLGHRVAVAALDERGG